VRHTTPEIYHATFAGEWVEKYIASKYVIFDPVVRWAVLNDGTCRWSEMSSWYVVGSDRVMKGGAEYGLNYGAVLSTRNALADGKKCVFSASRADREFDDTELKELERWFERLIIATGGSAGLTAVELETLRLLAQGNTHQEAADILGVSAAAIKARMKRICVGLNAKNSAHALVIAAQKGLVFG
jgi:LuxR family transcriptional regulator